MDITGMLYFWRYFVILSLMTLKLGNSEQNCEKKKCFKGFKTLGRRSRVLTNRGCKVLHTKLNFRSPYSHAENTAVPFCAGVENKQCFSPPSRAGSGEPRRRVPPGVCRERAGAGGGRPGGRSPRLRVRLRPRSPPPRSGRSFWVTRTTFFSPAPSLQKPSDAQILWPVSTPPPHPNLKPWKWLSANWLFLKLIPSFFPLFFERGHLLLSCRTPQRCHYYLFFFLYNKNFRASSLGSHGTLCLCCLFPLPLRSKGKRNTKFSQLHSIQSAHRNMQNPSNIFFFFL